MDADEIRDIRDSRFQKAVKGRVETTYTFQTIAKTSIKAGTIAAVTGMTTETVHSYRAWKSGKLSKEQYLKEIFKAGGDAGAAGTMTSAAMIPVQAAITAAGASSFVAIVFGAAVNAVVTPCFARGKYRQILNEARYYQAIESIYDDFTAAVERSAAQDTVHKFLWRMPERFISG